MINQRLGIKYPLLQGAMAWISHSSLVAAVSNAGGLGNILGGLLGAGGASSSSVGGGILASILDQDGDGQLGVGDLLSAVSGPDKKSGGLGGLLGGLFGKQ